MRFRWPKLLNLFGLTSRRNLDFAEDQEPHTSNAEQSVEGTATSENTTNIQPIVTSYNGESRHIVDGTVLEEEEDQATNPNNFFRAGALIEEETAAFKQTPLTKHQNDDQLVGPSCPEGDFPNAQPEYSEPQSSACTPLELRGESFSPPRGSSQKENESPSRGKIRRLSRAIERGRQICYRFDKRKGKYDVYASKTPGDDERESTDGGEPSDEGEPSDKGELNNEGELYDERELNDEKKPNDEREPSDEEETKDEVKQNLGIGPINPERHMLTPFQGSSQKESEIPSDETIPIEMGRGNCERFNNGNGKCCMFPLRTYGDDERGPDGLVEQGHSVETTPSEQHIVFPLQESSRKENISPGKRFGQVLEAVENKHQIQFDLHEESHGDDIYARTSSDGGRRPDGDVRYCFSGAPTNPGQDMYNRGISNAVARAPRQFGDVLRCDPGLYSLNDSNSTRSNDHEPCEDPMAPAEGKFEVDQGWSSDEDDIRPRTRPLAEENRGKYLAVMVQGKTMFRKISPIPFDIHKVPLLRTPSVWSGTTEPECDSPLYPYSCRAAARKANQTPSLASIEGPEIRQTSPSEEHPQDIHTWLERTKTSLPGIQLETPEAFEAWPDDEHDVLYLSGAQAETSLGFEILSDPDNGSPSSSSEQDDNAAEPFEPWVDGNPSTPQGQEGNEKVFGIGTDNELGDLTPDGNENKATGLFDIWEDDEPGDHADNGIQKGTAESFDIWEDNELTHRPPTRKQKKTAVSFAVWNDGQRGILSSSQPITALPCDALRNVTNIPRSHSLMKVDSMRASAVAWDMPNYTNTQRVASLRKARRLPHPGRYRLDHAARLPEIGQAADGMQHYDFDHAQYPSNALWSSAALGNDNSSEDGEYPPVPQHRRPLAELGSSSPCSPSPMRIATNHATTVEAEARQRRGPARGESCAFAPARLEGSSSATPVSPTQRYAHPIPRRWIDPDALFEHFHRAAGTSSFRGESNFRDFGPYQKSPFRGTPGQSARQSRYRLRAEIGDHVS